MQPTVFALSDDTTGALEVGAHFAAAGVLTRVVPHENAGLTAPVDALVVDAQTRHVSPEEAHDRAFHVAAAARGCGIRHFYKKTDSTLRGHIAAEFRGLLEAWPDAILVFAPAYPKLGRTVVKGELYVEGCPLAETAFSKDRLTPSREGSIPTLLSRGGAGRVISVADSGQFAEVMRRCEAGSIVVCDGSEEKDLEAVGEALAAVDRPHIAAGPGGLAYHWIRRVPVVARRAAPEIPTLSRCLVVGGSLHPASRNQVHQATEQGAPVVHLGSEAKGAEDAAGARLLAEAVAARRWPLLTTPDAANGAADAVAARIAAFVRRVFDFADVDGLVVFGGDTAYAILQALGSSAVEPCGEIIPGVPVSVALCPARRFVLVTKAGGFGPPEILASIKARLEKKE